MISFKQYVKETKSAPRGHYFTKSGNLVKGRLTKDARERGSTKSDPKDKQRSKVPPVTQVREAYKPPPGTGADTSWEDGDIKITLDDIKKVASPEVKENPLKFKDILIDTSRDPERVNRANLNYEIYVARRNGNSIKVLDGQHRIVKAIRDKKPVKVRYIDLENVPEEM